MEATSPPAAAVLFEISLQGSQQNLQHLADFGLRRSDANVFTRVFTHLTNLKFITTCALQILSILLYFAAIQRRKFAEFQLPRR